MSDKNEHQIEIELSEEMAEGIYCNFVIITHSPHEFVMDYVRMMPGVPKAKVKSRIIMTPEHAKRLTLALGDNLTKYEDQFGEIELKEQNGPAFPMNFNGPTGQA